MLYLIHIDTFAILPQLRAIVYEEPIHRTLCYYMAAPLYFRDRPYGIRHPLWKEAGEPYII